MDNTITLSNNQLDNFNRLTPPALASVEPLRIGVLKLQLHFLRFDRLDAGFRVPEHVHPNYEIAVVRRGAMTTWFDNLRVECTPRNGKILIIPPSAPHRRDFAADTPTVNESLAFSLSSASFSGEAAAQQVATEIIRAGYSFELTAEMEGVLKMLDRQAHKESDLAQPMIVTLTHAFLLLLFERNFAGLFQDGRIEREKTQWEFRHDRISTIKAFVEYSINSNCPLSDCAQLCGMGMRHLSRIFEQATGQSIYRYCTERRFAIARRQLLFSDRSIAEIANAMHFRNAGAFSRFFRLHGGLSPGEFREQERQNTQQ